MKKYFSLIILAVILIIPSGVFAQTASPSTQGDVTPTNTPTCVSLNYNLQQRSKDSQTKGQVSDLQSFLQVKGYLNSDPTGYFGIQTIAAVKAFQAANNLLAQGYVGPQTRAKINTASCGGTTSTPSANISKPYVTISNNAINDGNGLHNGIVELADITVTADAIGAIKVDTLPLTIATQGNFTFTFRNDFFVVKDAGGNVISTVTVDTTNVVMPKISFSNGYTIAAGSSQTFRIYATVTGVSGPAGTNSITTKLGSPSLFTWTDINSSSAEGAFDGNSSPNYPGSSAPTPTPTPTNISVTSVYPTAGPVGTTVNIIGTGFSPTGNTVHFASGGSRNVSSSNGTNISYVIPSITKGCDINGGPGVACPSFAQLITPGTYQLSVADSSGALSNAVNFMVAAAVPTSTQPSIQATASVIGNPTLKLTYDSAQKESSLVASAVVKITAGTTDLKVSWLNAIPVGIKNVLTGNFVSVNSDQLIATVDKSFSQNSDYTYTIPAGTSATFTGTRKLDPRQMFAGQYAAVVLPINDFTNPINVLSIPVPANISNTVTVVGEVSPYISSITSPVDVNKTVTVTGVRFNSKDSVIIDGVPFLLGKGDLTINTNSITFTPSTFNILAGSHVIQISDLTTGASNTVGFQLAGTKVSPTPIPASPTITLFAAKDPNPTNGSVIMVWQSSATPDVATDAILEMDCKPGSISFTTDKGNYPTCEKGGVWYWYKNTSGSIIISPSGNITSVTVPFKLTLTKNGSSIGQTQTIYVTFPATSVSPAPTLSVQINGQDATNPVSVTSGQWADVTWISTNATACTFAYQSTNGPATLSKAVSDTMRMGPYLPGAGGSYTITCSNASGQSVSKSVSASAPAAAAPVTPPSIPTPLPTPTPTPISSTLPIGSIDAINCDTGIVGWACDADSLTYALPVNIGTDAGYGNPAQTSAYNWNQAGQAACKGTTSASAYSSDKHGFQVPIPALWKDGKVYRVYATAQDVTAAGSLTSPSVVNNLNNSGTYSVQYIASSTIPASGIASADRKTLYCAIKTLQPFAEYIQPSQLLGAVGGIVVTPTQLSAASAASGIACTNLSTNLQYQSNDTTSNGAVTALQTFLKAEGYLGDSPSGIFGLHTYTAVQAFQSQYAIDSTGYVGASTRAKIQQVSCQ